MVRFLVSTQEEQKKALKEAAKKRGQTLNGLIRQILWDWVKKEKEETNHE